LALITGLSSLAGIRSDDSDDEGDSIKCLPPGCVAVKSGHSIMAENIRYEPPLRRFFPKAVRHG
ncbi:MAG: hypothetical protein QW692_02385, partial [Nitrososphaerota archaeon]